MAKTKANKKKPHTALNNATALIERGIECMLEEMYDKAIENFTAALALKPDDVGALFCRGLAYYNIGDIDNALAGYEAALKIKPEHFSALYNKGIALFRKKEYDNAIAALDAAIKMDPESPEAQCVRANAHLINGRYDNAIADYTAALNIYEKWIEEDEADDDQYMYDMSNITQTLYDRGMVYKKIGDKDKAIADYEIAIKMALEIINGDF
jgi:tetratricopeptide (TPR) repeat protein